MWRSSIKMAQVYLEATTQKKTDEAVSNETSNKWAVGWSNIYLLFPFHLKLEFFYLSFSKFWLKKTQLPKDIVILYNDFYEDLIYTTMIKSTEFLSTLFSWPLFNIFPLYFYFLHHYIFSIPFLKSQSHGCSFFFSTSQNLETGKTS